MAQSHFQKFADGHGRQSVLLPAGFESKDILFLNLYLCCVLYQDNALVIRNELRQYIGESRLATRGSPTNKDVLPLGNVLLQLFCEFSGDRSHFDEVFHLEFVGIELPDGESHAMDAARRNYGCNAAAIWQP